MIRLLLREGDRIERNLEGEWFPASIVEIDQKDELMSIKYLDDGKVEFEVPFRETRRYNEDVSRNRSIYSRNRSIYSSESKNDPLPRPLAGLIEDDYDVRNQHIPTVFRHDVSNVTDHAIVLNGEENKLAAGGGLRALRYLKKQ